MTLLQHLVSACAVSLILLPGLAAAGPVNDSGIVLCRAHGTGADTPISTAPCQALPVHGAQDAHGGRDAAAAAGELPKIGAGSKGFDYTKISNSGQALPATAELGASAGQWGCTYDNHTGLMWEIKLNSPTHLRHMRHTYTWYQDGNSYGGPGVPDGIGEGGICKTDGRCDTQAYISDVNAAGLCGKTDWRLPTREELYNLADRGRLSPSIDPDYFPNTPSFWFWTASPVAGQPAMAWVTNFNRGSVDWNGRGSQAHVRLVRRGR